MPPVDTHDPWFWRKNLPVRSSPYSIPADRASRKAEVNTFWHTSTLGSASTSTSTTINECGHSSHSVAYPSVPQLHTMNSTEPDSATNLQYPQIAEVQAESGAGGHLLDLGPGFNDEILMGPEQLVEDIDEWGNLELYPDWLRALCEAGPTLPTAAAAGDGTIHSNQAEVVEPSANAGRRATVDSIDTQPPLAISCPLAPSSTSSATSSFTENSTSDNVHPNTVIQTGLALEHALPSPLAIASLTRCSSSCTQAICSTAYTSTKAAFSCANPSNLPWTQSVLATSGALSLSSAKASQLCSCASCSISMAQGPLEISAAIQGVPLTALRVENSTNSYTRFGSFRTVSMPSSVDGQFRTIPVEFPCVTSSWSLPNLDERAPNTSISSQGEPHSTHVPSDRCPPERQSQLAADVPQRGPAYDIHQNGLTFPLHRLQVSGIRPWIETTSELLRLAGSFRWRDPLPGDPGAHERAAQSLRHVLEKANWMSSESIKINGQSRRQAVSPVHIV